MAFNLTVLSNLLGTPLEPDFAGVDLLIEDVSEQLYRIDRTMFHVTASANIRRAGAAAARPGRRYSCKTTRISAPTKRRLSRNGARRSGIRYGGRADIGHDAAKPGRSVRARKFAESPLHRAIAKALELRSTKREQQEGLMAQGTGRKAGGGLARPVQPSADLAKITGSAPLPRSQVVSKVWDHIRKNNLQNPQNKREIVADATLKPIFGGKDRVSMFEMNKHLSNHLK